MTLRRLKLSTYEVVTPREEEEEQQQLNRKPVTTQNIILIQRLFENLILNMIKFYIF
jgi:hypothetical protein